MTLRVLGLSFVLASASVAQVTVPPPPPPAPTPEPAPPPPPATRPTQPPPGTPTQAGPQPKISVDRVEHDWGRVDDTHKLTTEFKITNKGEGPLQILDLKPSCGCVQATIRGWKRDEKKPIAPGETVVLDVEFDPFMKQEHSEYTIFVRSNDPSQLPSLDLKLKAHIDATVAVDQREGVAVGELEFGDGKTVEVLVTGRKEGFKATGASVVVSNNLRLRARVTGTREVVVNGEKRSQSTVQVTIPRDAVVGKFTGKIHIRHNDPRVGRLDDKTGMIDVAISGEIIGNVKSTPPAIALGARQPGEAVAFELELHHSRGKPFTLGESRYEPRVNGKLDLTINSTPLPSGEGHKVSVVGTLPTKTLSYSGELQFVLPDTEGQRVVRVPLTVSTVREQPPAGETAPPQGP